MAIKILYVLGALDYCNGIASYSMNYYKKINRKDFDIDFAVHYDFDTEYKKEILRNDNKVFFMGDYSIKSMLGLKKRIQKLFLTNKYDIIHCHNLNVSYFYFSVAKKMGINVRILHSHATKNSDNIIKNIRNKLLSVKGKKLATTYFSCSIMAGEYLFKKKKFTVIKNAIDYNEFKYNNQVSYELKKQYEIPNDNIVLGFIGRFTNQKNIPFLLKIFEELDKSNVNYTGFFIGDGSQKFLIDDFLMKRNSNKKIFLINSTSNISSYYSLFDILILPSLFEGLPVTGVEAQVAGCKVLVSNRVTKELNFSSKCIYLGIENVSEWVDCIISYKKENDRLNVPNDYNIDNEVLKLELLYKELLG